MVTHGQDIMSAISVLIPLQTVKSKLYNLLVSFLGDFRKLMYPNCAGLLFLHKARWQAHSSVMQPSVQHRARTARPARRVYYLLGSALLMTFLCVLFYSQEVLAEDAPKRQISHAERYLGIFEKKVKRMRGSPFRLDYDANEALRRIKELKKNYPDDASVEALFQRARTALKASKGETFQITEAMLSYQNTEKILVDFIAQRGREQWQTLINDLDAQNGVLQAFPMIDPQSPEREQFIGRRVLLDKVRYPDNQFMANGFSYLHVGSASQGFYYLSLSSSQFRTAYEAIRRYRRLISPDETVEWQVIGTVRTVNLLRPSASLEDTTTPLSLGYVVEPDALYIEGKVLALPGQDAERIGYYAGEEDIDNKKAEYYTVQTFPENVEPLDFLRIFATAIKEKNYQLYLDGLCPERKASDKALALMQRRWQYNQARYVNQYVHIEPLEVSRMTVIAGEKIDDTESFFLDEEEQAEIKERAGDIVEEAEVRFTAYNERGVQVGRPRPIYLRRKNENRWCVISGVPL